MYHASIDLLWLELGYVLEGRGGSSSREHLCLPTKVGCLMGKRGRDMLVKVCLADTGGLVSFQTNIQQGCNVLIRPLRPKH